MARKTKSYIQQGTSQRKDAHYANLSFGCGILSWIPLINIALIPLGIVFGIMGIRVAAARPATHGGMARAIIGLTICSVWLAMTVYAMVVYGPAALLTR